MGLDVYTYTKDAQEQSDAFDEAFRDFNFTEADESERNAYHDAQEALPGQVDVPSVKHPDHLCNRRYLRSSYNNSGFNRAVPLMTGNENDTFYGVLEPVLGGVDDYLIKVEDDDRLVAARDRAESLLARLNAVDAVFGVEDQRAVAMRPEWNFTSPDDVLAAYRGEAAAFVDYRDLNDVWSAGSYSSGKGAFFLDEPLKVRAAMPGTDILGAPCVWLIYELDSSTKDHYVASAEVLIEFIDELRDLVKQDGVAYLHWSA